MAGINNNSALHLTKRESQMSSGTNRKRNRASSEVRYSPYTGKNTEQKFVFCLNLLKITNF